MFNSEYTINPSTYFSIKPGVYTTDNNFAHCINVQGYSKILNIKTRVLIAFEDRPSTNTDWDFNDVILSVSSDTTDDNQIDDTDLILK